MEFIFIATAHFLALLSPGPDFFLIMQAALRLPPRYGIAICVGIAFANGTYLLLAVLGLLSLLLVVKRSQMLKLSCRCYSLHCRIYLPLLTRCIAGYIFPF